MSSRTFARACGLTLALFATLSLAAPGHAVSYQDATGAPVKAAFAEGRLWVLSDKGVLTSFAESDPAPRVEIAEDVLRFCVLDGAPLAVTGKYKIERAWRLHRHGADGWADFATVKVAQEHLNAVACDAGAVTLFAAKRNIRVDAAGQRSTNYKFVRGAREAGESTTSVLATPSALYVASDYGVTGGLLRADPATGEAAPITGRGSGQCPGQLAGFCDPVQAIASSPNDGCFVAAVGRATTPSAGRVLEICGETIRQLYAKPAGGSATVPFVDIARSGPSIWLSGGDGLTRLTGERAEYVGLPPMKTVGDYRVTFALPGVVAIRAADGPILLAPR